MKKPVLLLTLVLLAALALRQGQLRAQAGPHTSPLINAGQPSATGTPPASQCVQDANANGVGDVVDVQATASDPGCQVYLPLVAAQWRQPWPAPTPTPTPDHYEPPINVIFNVHMEPFAPVPLPQRQQEYEARRQELELSLEWAVTYGIKLTIKAGGEFVEFCLDDGECDENPPAGLFADLRDQGIEVGTHWHTNYQQGPHIWPDVPDPDEATARRIVTDNRAMVDRVIGAENNKAAGGIASYPGMYTDQAFTMAPGLGETGESQFGHVVWNPWRPGDGAGFPEDLSNEQYVAIPHLPQIGLTGGVGQHTASLILPHAQRSFLMIFLEWTGLIVTEAPMFVEPVADQVILETPHGVVRLPNGNTLITDGGHQGGGPKPTGSSEVLEVDAAGNVVWSFRRGLVWAHDADRLPNGHTILGDSRNGRIIQVDGEGTIVWEYRPAGADRLRFPKDADRLPGGNVLITDSHNHRIVEVTPDGTVVWEYATDLYKPYDADRLANGNTLISGTAAGEVIEVSPAGSIVWQYPPGEMSAPAGYLIISYNANYMWGPPVRVQEATAGQFVPALNRHLDLMDRLGITADYYFTGLAAEKLDEWSRETVTRLLESAHDVHYHGANRPPYPQLVDQVLGEDWEQDLATAREYEAAGANPATGEHVGGITAFRDVFGQDPFATGRFFEASILAVDKEMGARMAVGLVDNLALSGANVTGAARDDAWFLGVLNRPTQAGLGASRLVQAGLGASRLVQAALTDQGDDYLSHARTILTAVSSPMPLVAFPIHDHDFFRHSQADQEKVWALYEEVLLLAQELGFQVVTMRDVYGMVQNGPAPTLTRHDLVDAAQSLVQIMEATGYPPESATSVATLSLAEAFEGLARALAAYGERGNLPASVETHDLLGPTSYFTSSVALATVSADAVLDAAVAVATAITDRVPSQVTIQAAPSASFSRPAAPSAAFAVNPAEFLYLMAQEYMAVAGGGPAPVTVRPISTLPLSVIQNQDADPLTRLQFWTYKPALFHSSIRSKDGDAQPRIRRWRDR